MRAVIVILALVVLCALVGWITFSNGPGRKSINLETDEIREDTKEVMQLRSGAAAQGGRQGGGRDQPPKRTDAARRRTSRHC